MVATRERRGSSHTKLDRRSAKDTLVPSSNGTGESAAAAASAGSAGKPAPRRVTARGVAARLGTLAAKADTLNGRTRLRRLASLVRKDGRNARRMAFLEAAIGESLDDVATATTPAERWATCEAATWALAWMARTKRAGGSAGGLLERIVGQARAAQTLLASGDTQPARFVLVLASVFADVEACRCLEAAAATALAAEIERLVSGEGVPALNGSATIVDRVVRWTAAREIARESPGRAWSKETERRWRSAATATLRLLGGGGRALSGAGRMPEAVTRDLLDAIASCGGRREKTVQMIRRPREAHGRGLLGRASHDAAAGVAIIRSGWDRRDLRVMVEYRHPVPRIEIAVDDRLLVEGPWQCEIWADGRGIEPEGAWTATCWESDRKATFLEIVAPLEGGRQIARQVVVLPHDRVVLLADAVTAPAGVGAALRYRGVIPLAASLDASAAEETREITVADVRPRVLAMPLALGEWRAASGGDFLGEPGSLSLVQTGDNRLYAPVWLDCDPRRFGRPLTWRQLTVADTRTILPRHQAAGFRVQEGRDQWLVYRALDQPRNRTLLGCNVSCEFLLGRIRRSGEVARTLEIE